MENLSTMQVGVFISFCLQPYTVWLLTSHTCYHGYLASSVASHAHDNISRTLVEFF